MSGGGGDVIAGAFHDAIDDASGIPDECPITPLGYWQNGRIFVLDGLGLVRDLDGDRLFRNALSNLCGGNTDWLATAFPLVETRGKHSITIEGAFDPTEAGDWLRRACAARGLYAPETPVFGLGTWRTPGGDLIANFGDVIWRPSDRTFFEAVGLVIDNVVITRSPSVARPDFGNEASDDDACELRDRLGSCWRFARDFDADLLMGWIIHCYLGAYLPWRCHMIVTGQTGSGKSWLSQFTEGLLAGASRPTLNNVSAAGIISQASNDSRAVILDEAERDDDSTSRIRKVVELMRLTNTAEGARISRGTADGSYRYHRLTNAFGLFCILSPKLLPADRSRITRLDLQVLFDQDDPAQREAIEADPEKITREASDAKRLIADAKVLGPRLHARVLKRAHLFDTLFEIYHRAFASAKIGTHDVDQFATLLACRDLGLYDDIPDASTVASEIEKVRPLIEGAKQNREDGEGTQCWNFLLTTISDMWRAGSRKTVAQQIQLGLYGATGESSEACQSLAQLGIKVVKPTATTPASVLICRNHATLDKQFAGQPRWTENGYSDALMYLPGAEYTEAHRFAGYRQRAIRIPAEHLPESEASASAPPSPRAEDDL